MSVLWIIVLCLVALVWVLSAVDIVRRHYSGWTTAGWLAVIVILPIVGSIIYWFARKPTREDAEQQYLADVFGRHDISGWAKAAWTVFIVVLPYLGVLIYLIANSKDMAERKARASQASRAEFDDYVKTVAGPGGAAAEIDKAKQLLDSGAITQAEFEAIKAKALA